MRDHGRPRPRRDAAFPADHGDAGFGGVLDVGAVIVALFGMACGAALVLRRLEGEATLPPGAAPLVATAGVGMALVAAIDRLVPRRSWPRWVARAGLALAVAALAPPLALLRGPAARPVEGLLAIMAVSSVTLLLLAPLARAGSSSPLPEVLQRGRLGRRTRPDRREHGWNADRKAVTPGPAPPPRPVVTPSEPAPVTEAVVPMAATALPPGAGPLWQRFARFAIPSEGVECQQGTLLLSVAAGSRSATGHVGFCPPFAALPQVEVGTSSEEIEATIVAAEILPWGVRVECRLDEPADEAIDISVEVVARAPFHPSAPLPRR